MTTKPTIDFQVWLDNLDDTDIEDIYCLYESIVNKTQIGHFNCIKQEDILIVQSGDNDQILKLVSESAIKTFLNILDNKYGGEYKSVVNQYDFIRVIRKND